MQLTYNAVPEHCPNVYFAAHLLKCTLLLKREV